jgi:hypothetical protein
VEDRLEDNKLYWVRYDETWRIAKWVEAYRQFQFIGRTIYGLSDILEIDYKPIERKS